MPFNYPIIVKKETTGEWQRPVNWLQRPSIGDNESVVWMLVRVYKDYPTIVAFYSGSAAGYLSGFIVNYGYGEDTYTTNNTLAIIEIDYSQVDDDWWDIPNGDKQLWISIRPRQSDGLLNSLSFFSTSAFTNKTDNNATANDCIIEILCGKFANITSAYGFRFDYLINCKAIICFYDIIYNNITYRLFFYNYNLEYVKATFVFNINILGNNLINTWNLKYSKDLIFKSNVSISYSSLFCNSGITELDLSDFYFRGSNSLFSNNYSLKKVKINLSQTTDTCATMCYQNYSLTDFIIVAGDGANVTSYNQAFYYCRSLKETPALNLNSSTNNLGMFEGCWSLTKSNLLNIKSSISFRDCNLSYDEIEKIFTYQLQTVDTTQTIDLRGNPDITNLPSSIIQIATDKNWSVLIS